NGWEDAFVHDRQTGITERVSVASDGTQADVRSGACSMCGLGVPAISADGRFVAFFSLAGNLAPGGGGRGTKVFVRDRVGGAAQDVFVHDRQTGTTERVSVASDGTPGNDYSVNDAISADGRFVAFHSRATNLVAGDTNGVWDVFVHDRQTGTTERVSVASD